MIFLRKRHRIAPCIVQNLVSDGGEAHIETTVALVGFVFNAGLVGVDEIVLAEFVGREIGHDDVGAGEDGFLAALRVDGLVSSGGHHVDFRHHQAKDGNHLQGQFHAFLGRRNLVPKLPKRCVGVRDKRPHADHGHVFLFEKEQVVSKVIKCLERQTHHHASACLVTQLQQCIDAI